MGNLPSDLHWAIAQQDLGVRHLAAVVATCRAGRDTFQPLLLDARRACEIVKKVFDSLFHRYMYAYDDVWHPRNGSWDPSGRSGGPVAAIGLYGPGVDWVMTGDSVHAVFPWHTHDFKKAINTFPSRYLTPQAMVLVGQLEKLSSTPSTDPTGLSYVLSTDPTDSYNGYYPSSVPPYRAPNTLDCHPLRTLFPLVIDLLASVGIKTTRPCANSTSRIRPYK